MERQNTDRTIPSRAIWMWLCGYECFSILSATPMIFLPVISACFTEKIDKSSWERNLAMLSFAVLLWLFICARLVLWRWFAKTGNRFWTLGFIALLAQGIGAVLVLGLIPYKLKLPRDMYYIYILGIILATDAAIVLCGTVLACAVFFSRNEQLRSAINCHSPSGNFWKDL